MSDSFKRAALVAFRLALRPIIRMLLWNGVTWKEAAEICKQAYVEVASGDYGVHGRPTNASRISILTGLSRREVKRVRDTLAAGEPAEIQRMNSATMVLGAWHTDPEFQDAEGGPAGLDFDGSPESFAALCRRYAPDIPPTAMIKELVRVGAVSEDPDGIYRASMRYYMPEHTDPDAVLRAGSVLEDLGTTLEYNLARKKDDVRPTRFEGRASNASVPARDVDAFREYLETEGQAMLERVDEWLSRREAPRESKRSLRKVRLGVGIYQIQE